MKQGEAKNKKIPLMGKWLKKQSEHANLLAEKSKKESELAGLKSPEKIKKIGLMALISYGISISLFIIASIVGGAVSTPLTIAGLLAFAFYGFVDAKFCSANARNFEFAFLNIPTIGLFGLVDIIIRMKRAPLMKEIYKNQIAELSKKEMSLRAEISELENKIGEAKKNIKELKNK